MGGAVYCWLLCFFTSGPAAPQSKHAGLQAPTLHSITKRSIPALKLDISSSLKIPDPSSTGPVLQTVLSFHSSPEWGRSSSGALLQSADGNQGLQEEERNPNLSFASCTRVSKLDTQRCCSRPAPSTAGRVPVLSELSPLQGTLRPVTAEKCKN